MKIATGQIDGFLRRPDPQIRAVLLYGPDAGLVRERADTLAKTICPELHDPFRVAELTGAVLAADPARLVDEAAQISLMGGRRVVRADVQVRRLRHRVLQHGLGPVHRAEAQRRRVHERDRV